MIDAILLWIRDTQQDGIGQAILAFSAWIYTAVLLAVIIYYLIRRFLKMYFE